MLATARRGGTIHGLPQIRYNTTMTKIHQGYRIGKDAKLRVGCSAVIFDPTRQKVLLTRRSDNGLWCLPSGGMDPGESAEEACVREVWEETGLRVQVTRLVGIYTTPNEVIEYPDGNRVQIVALSFEATVTGGQLGLSDETTAAGYYSPTEMATLDLIPSHARRVRDAFAGQTEAFLH